MRIFLSYATEQKPEAEAIAFSLRSRGHMVFFDRDDLPDGESYDDKIARAVERSDLMIFLISPASVSEGRYTLTELRFARHKWRNPGGRVLPVMLEPTPMADVPSYLKAVSILEPHGNKAAEVAFAIARLRGIERALNTAAIAAAVGAVFAFLAGLMPVQGVSHSWLPLRKVLKVDVALENGALLAILFVGLYFVLGDRKWWKVPILAAGGMAGWVLCLFVFYNVGNEANAPLFSGPPISEFRNIIDAVPEAARPQISSAIEKVETYLTGAGEAIGRWSATLVMAVCGLACLLPISLAMALVDRRLRSLTRLVVASFFASAAGAAGYLLCSVSGLGELSNRQIFWFLDFADLFFALLYLPWLIAVPAAFAYWLIRGQE